ncbi:hypothetical protein BB561_004030 [Smittium simulii]|uniref:poly(A)-specific ribonuclease n=1 Tax=Smittium simulii TaxID=133385 RepID=A0A2T9YIH6_9FUNG|nr:hypothetical protein BB561_004030 [Smittium simulii]
MGKTGPVNGQTSLAGYNGLVASRISNSHKNNPAINWGLNNPTQLNSATISSNQTSASTNNLSVQNQPIQNVFQNNSTSNLQIMNLQYNLDNRNVYPTSKHHQIQLAIQQRSRASATPHHHAKTAMAMMNNQATLNTLMNSNSYNTANFQSSKNDSYNSYLTYSDDSTAIFNQAPQDTSIISSPPNFKRSQQDIKTPNAIQFNRSATANSADLAGLSRITKSADSNRANYTLNNSSEQASSIKYGWDAIDLGGMGLRSLSNELFNYNFLVKLYINHNQLTFLPSSISKLKNLEVLDASGNQITSIPSQIGLCCKLKELLLFDNRITELPFELGTLYQLETLGLEGNPTSEPTRSLLQKKGTRVVIEYLRDIAPPAKIVDDRSWISVDKTIDVSSSEVVSVVSYNVLGSKYATSQQYAYCPSWALSWENRREIIISELLALSSDIICLQEVETAEYSDFFSAKLNPAGYEGIFWAKSRARTMPEAERKSVDGCATFFKSNVFTLVSSHLLEFQPSALKRSDFRKSEDFFNRFMTKDNICGFGVLQHKLASGNPKIVVANAHIHWNPEFTDVKMVQVTMMMEELKSIASNYTGANFNSSNQHNNRMSKSNQNSSQKETQPTVLICGDFNSTPDSGLYEYLSTSKLSKAHDDMAKLESYSDYTEKGLTHDFSLKSAYASIGEMDITNYTPTFKGVIDYIWYSTSTLQLAGLLGPIDPVWLSQQVGFPNAQIPSDHIPLMAEFKFKS